MERAQVSLLAQARYDEGWSQERLAILVGVEVRTVIRWEQGTSTPHPRHLVHLCKLFKKTPQELGFKQVFARNEAMQEPVAAETLGEQRAIPDDEAQEDEYASWRSQNLSIRLLSIVWNWPFSYARYHQFQVMIALEQAKDGTMTSELTRRNALKLLASLPIELCGLSALHPILKKPTEEILKMCAAGITACWYIRRGKESGFVNQTISKYVPTLKEIVKVTSEESQRKVAADTLAQCYLLKSKLAMHLTTNSDAIRYAKLAEVYSEKAENLILQIGSLRRLEAEYYYACLYEQALQTAKKAKYLLEQAKIPISHKLHSYIYAGLASNQAFFGQRSDALFSLGKAHTTFFTEDEEPVPVWVDYDQSMLIINDGLTHLYLGLFEKAADSFKQVELAASSTESKRTQAFINQVMVEVSRDDQSRDMEYCIARWKQGIEGAKELQSEQWFSEARQAYLALRAAWPHEKSVKELRDHINHW